MVCSIHKVKGRLRLRILVIAILSFIQLNLSAQNKSQYPFRSGERVTYTAYYNWKFIWLSAGLAEFYVKDTVLNNEPAFHFLSFGQSHSSYDWFFKVRDRFESVARKANLSPMWFLRDTYEGGYKAFNRYSFSYSDSVLTIDSYTSNRPFSQKKFKFDRPIFDVLTAIYYCRTVDFSKLRKGERLPLTMAVDDGVYDLYIRYLGNEKIQHRDGRVFDTFKFSVMLVEGTIFKGGEDMFVWVSADERKLPILVEAKILIGSVKAYLLDYKPY